MAMFQSGPGSDGDTTPASVCRHEMRAWHDASFDVSQPGTRLLIPATSEYCEHGGRSDRHYPPTRGQ
jgi:hypothetical protein